MPFEHFRQPVLPRRRWMRRVVLSLGLAVAMTLISLSIGVMGYHILGNLPWVDAVLEASMILGGMGPVAVMSNDDVKMFASVYALFSGLMLVTTTGILLGPWLHRLLHQLHADDETPNSKGNKP